MIACQVRPELLICVFEMHLENMWVCLPLSLFVQIRSLEDESLCIPVNGDIHSFWLEGDKLREGNKKNNF